MNTYFSIPSWGPYRIASELILVFRVVSTIPQELRITRRTAPQFYGTIPPARRWHLRTCGNIQHGSNCLRNAAGCRELLRYLTDFFRDVFVEWKTLAFSWHTFKRATLVNVNSWRYKIHIPCSNFYGRTQKLCLLPRYYQDNIHARNLQY